MIVLKQKRRKAKKAGSKQNLSGANRNIKDGVFRLLFAVQENAAELYYAITDKKCNPDEIQIITIETIISGKMKNDLAFVVNDKIMVIGEHVSGSLANMPVRILMYSGALYEKWIKMKDEYDFLFGSGLYKIPAPELVLFYNGTENRPEKEILRLSTAFKTAVDKNFGKVELEVPVYNINKGMNTELFNRSEKLSHYAEFIAKKREYLQLYNDYETAVKKAMEFCITNGILDEFLKEHGGRIVSILSTEFDLDAALKVQRKEGREEGLREGSEKGKEEERVEIAKRLLSLNITIQDIIKATGLTAEQINSLAA